MASKLMIHAGGYEAALADVRARTQYGEFLDLVTRSVSAIGRPNLERGQYALRDRTARDGSVEKGAQFFAVVPVDGVVKPEDLSPEARAYLTEAELLANDQRMMADPVAIAIGLQDSADRSLPARVSGGTYVFNCDNTAMHGDFTVTANKGRNDYWEELQKQVEEAMVRLPKVGLGLYAEAAQMRHFHPSDIEIDALLGQLLRRGALPGSTLGKVPGLLCSEDEIRMHGQWDKDGRPSAWRVYNALTAAQKERPVRTQHVTGRAFSQAMSDIGLAKGRAALAPQLQEALAHIERELIAAPMVA